ncbi:hypothetical protein LXL04_028118 [Taraxacum kok-saghyz]
MKLEKLGIPAAVSIQFLGPASLVVERAVVPTAKTMDITDNSSFEIMKPKHQGHEHTPTVPPYSLRTTAIFWRRTVMTPVAALTPASPKTVVAASVKSAIYDSEAQSRVADPPAPPAFSAIADLDYCTAFSPLRYGFGYGWYGLGMQVSEVDAPERNGAYKGAIRMLEVLSNPRNLFKFEPTLVDDGLQTHPTFSHLTFQRSYEAMNHATYQKRRFLKCSHNQRLVICKLFHFLERSNNCNRNCKKQNYRKSEGGAEQSELMISDNQRRRSDADSSCVEESERGRRAENPSRGWGRQSQGRREYGCNTSMFSDRKMKNGSSPWDQEFQPNHSQYPITTLQNVVGAEFPFQLRCRQPIEYYMLMSKLQTMTKG